MNAWYASTNGDNLPRFNRALHEAAQERLVARGGLCIMYTHFGKGFVRGKQLDSRFGAFMRRLASQPGWFVPVRDVLDYLSRQKGIHVLEDVERAELERSWLRDRAEEGVRALKQAVQSTARAALSSPIEALRRRVAPAAGVGH